MTARPSLSLPAGVELVYQLAAGSPLPDGWEWQDRRGRWQSFRPHSAHRTCLVRPPITVSPTPEVP